MAQMPETMQDLCNPDFEFMLEEVANVLKALHLNSFTMGDYLVIVNGVADITYLGEPYLALQLWLSTRSGNFIGRVWSQSVSRGKVKNITQFMEACTSHFQGRPCLGHPIPVNAGSLQEEIVISQTPVPRRMSKLCQKVLSKDTNFNVPSCDECLMFKIENSTTQHAWRDPHNDVKQEDVDTDFEVYQDNPQDMLKDSQGEEKKVKLFQCDRIGPCQYQTRRSKDLKMHIKAVHDKIKDQVCGECGASFSYPFYLKKHKKDVHKKIEKSLCYKNANEDAFENKTVTETLCKSEEYVEDIEQEDGPIQNQHRVVTAEKKFQRGRSLRKQEEGPLHVKCEVCGIVISTKSYTKHMSREHDITGSLTRKCHWCDKVLRYDYLHSHAIKKHFWGRFSCHNCCFRAPFANKIIAHANEEHNEEGDLYTSCPSCEVTCRINEIENHYKECITKKFQERERLRERLRKEKDVSNIICNICGKFFKYKKSYKTHLKTHSEMEITKIEERLEAKYITIKENLIVKTLQNQKSQEIGPMDVRCNICGKVLDGHYYRVHMQKVHGKTATTTRKCHWCDKILNALNIKHHAMKYHFWGNFLCTKCGFKAPRAEELIVHVNNEHKDDGDFAIFCPSCNVKCLIGEIDHHYKKCITQKLQQRSRLRTEQSICNKICDICGKLFKHQQNYNCHMKTHEREKIANGEEVLQSDDRLHHYCDRCGQKFAHARTLQSHILRVHENVKFPCPSCPITFASKLRCIQHQRADHSTGTHSLVSVQLTFGSL